MKTSIAIVALATCLNCQAQLPDAKFEVASIRQDTSEIPPETQVTPGTLTVRNGTILYMMEWAYDVPRAQIDFPPALMDNRFDLIAKAAAPADEAHLRLMLQTLLADRFGLKIHKEARVVPVYVMTLAKGGPKFQEATTDGSFVLERPNPAILNAHHARMVDLAQGIAGQIGRPVVDATGLKGRYEIHMDISPYLVRTGGAGDGQVDMLGILFTGLRDLLGLSLESRKDSVEMLVIDSVEKSSTEN